MPSAFAMKKLSNKYSRVGVAEAVGGPARDFEVPIVATGDELLDLQ